MRQQRWNDDVAAMTQRTQRMYYTRRDWLLVEIIIGIVSISTGITGIAHGGILSNALAWTGDAGAWYGIFASVGALMILAALSEFALRQTKSLNRCNLCRFARLRMALHFFNGLSWLYAFTALLQAQAYMVSIFYEALPLLFFNIWGALEHAKALYLDMGGTNTTSLIRASLDRIRG